MALQWAVLNILIVLPSILFCICIILTLRELFLVIHLLNCSFSKTSSFWRKLSWLQQLMTYWQFWRSHISSSFTIGWRFMILNVLNIILFDVTLYLPYLLNSIQTLTFWLVARKYWTVCNTCLRGCSKLDIIGRVLNYHKSKKKLVTSIMIILKYSSACNAVASLWPRLGCTWCDWTFPGGIPTAHHTLPSV